MKIKVIGFEKYLYLSGETSYFRLALKAPSSLLFILQHLLFLTLYKTFGSKALKFMKAEIWRAYVESTLVIIGHDGVFGMGGALGVPIFYPLFVPLFAKWLGKPVVLYGGSFAPPRRLRWLRWLLDTTLKIILNRMDLITLRENISYQNLRSIGVQNNHVFVTADLAFLLQPVSYERVKEIVEQEGITKIPSPLIGMTITREIASKAFPYLNPRHSYDKHIKVLAQVIDHLVDKFAATVVFIPHCIGFGEELDDRIVAKDIFQKCQNKDRVKVITNEYSAAELKGLIGQFDFFVGERVHSVINAMSVGVPSIAISSSTDQRLDIIRMLGQDDAVYFVEGLNSEALLTKINDIWSKRDKVKEELKSQVGVIRERAMLNGKLLKELLDSKKVGG